MFIFDYRDDNTDKLCFEQNIIKYDDTESGIHGCAVYSEIPITMESVITGFHCRRH